MMWRREFGKTDVPIYLIAQVFLWASHALSSGNRSNPAV